ncbi:MAG: tyrosine-type recombinase/integrase [Bacilli bacterium]|nr:tyrosine-type recombinase/integrase [Bacilli bacterium]
MEILEKFKSYLEENYDTTENQNTIKSYLTDVNQFITYFKNEFGEDIVDFSRADYIEFKKYMKEKRSFKFSTMNRKTAALSIYENFLIETKIRKEEMKVIKKKDFYKIERPFITSQMLPKETIKKVRLRAGRENKRDYLMFILCDEGGLRVSEVIELQLARDIDFNMYSIRILGKGNKIRSIFMDQVIFDAINDYLPEREKLLNGRENKYLIVSNKTANTNKPMSRTSINTILNQYCDKVNADKINPHAMRHDSGTKKYEEGYSDIMLKKFLGHSSNATDIYTHPGGELYRQEK